MDTYNIHRQQHERLTNLNRRARGLAGDPGFDVSLRLTPISYTRSPALVESVPQDLI